MDLLTFCADSLRRVWVARQMACGLAAFAAFGCQDDTQPATTADVALDTLQADADTQGAGSDAAGPPANYAEAGPHPVGHTHLVLTDPQTQRLLPTTVWYPAAESARTAAATGISVATFLPEGATRTALSALLAKAPTGCTEPTARSAPEAEPAAGDKWPVVVFSHCHGCARFSAHTLAERLASHGFAVLAPDHTGNTLMEAEAGVTAPLTSAFLQVRGRDIRFVLDAVLAEDATVLPKPLQGRLDASRVGAMGHSFGSVTTGLMAQDDPRIDAAFCLAAPIDNPLLAGVSAAKVKVPIAFVLAQEDNSITEAGNLFLRQNYANVAGPAWLIELVDAGHWSFTDIAGLIEAFDPGCGEGLRMSDGVTPFAYVDPVVSRGMVARHAAAFFALHLRGETAARGTLELADPTALETVQSRP